MFHAPQPAGRYEPTLSDMMAAITNSKHETLARIDELAAGQAAQEEPLTRRDAEQRPTPAPSTTPSSAASSTAPDRHPDPHFRDRAIARLNTPTPVSLQALRTALDTLIAKAGIDGAQVKLLGP